MLLLNYKNYLFFLTINLLLKMTSIYYFNLEYYLRILFLKYLNIIAHHYPIIFNLLGLLVTLFNLLADAYYKLIEYRLFIISIKFIMYFFMDPSGLDIYTFTLLLDSICIIYTIYVKYIDKEFIYRYPRIHVFLEKTCNVLYIINIFFSIGTFIINWIKSFNNGHCGYSSDNAGPGSSDNNDNYPPSTDNGDYDPWNDKGGYAPSTDNGDYDPWNNNGNYDPWDDNGQPGFSDDNGGPSGGPDPSGGPSSSGDTVKKQRRKRMTKKEKEAMTKEEREAQEADRKAKRNESDRLKRANLSKANPVIFQSQSKKTELAKLRHTDAEKMTEEDKKRLNILRAEVREEAKSRREKKKAKLSEKQLEKDQSNRSNEYRLDADIINHPYTDQKLLKEWRDAFGDGDL